MLLCDMIFSWFLYFIQIEPLKIPYLFLSPTKKRIEWVLTAQWATQTYQPVDLTVSSVWSLLVRFIAVQTTVSLCLICVLFS